MTNHAIISTMSPRSCLFSLLLLLLIAEYAFWKKSLPWIIRLRLFESPKKKITHKQSSLRFELEMNLYSSRLSFRYGTNCCCCCCCAIKKITKNTIPKTNLDRNVYHSNFFVELSFGSLKFNGKENENKYKL